ncbi:hypothetical protein ACUXK4_001897 [Methylorubrum extorquens]
MSASDETPDASVLAVIRVEEAHREAVMRDLLDLAERGQETAKVLSAL